MVIAWHLMVNDWSDLGQLQPNNRSPHLEGSAPFSQSWAGQYSFSYITANRIMMHKNCWIDWRDWFLYTFHGWLLHCDDLSYLELIRIGLCCSINVWPVHFLFRPTCGRTTLLNSTQISKGHRVGRVPHSHWPYEEKWVPVFLFYTCLRLVMIS